MVPPTSIQKGRVDLLLTLLFYKNFSISEHQGELKMQLEKLNIATVHLPPPQPLLYLIICNCLFESGSTRIVNDASIRIGSRAGNHTGPGCSKPD